LRRPTLVSARVTPPAGERNSTSTDPADARLAEARNTALELKELYSR